MRLVDTHCHLDYPDFDLQRREVIERAIDNGLGAIINPGSNLESSRKSLELAERFDILSTGVGIHPNYGDDWKHSSLNDLEELAANNHNVAIGEIGLDYYHDRIARDLQKGIFKEQLNLAADMSLPVIVHNREANADVIEILSQWQKRLGKKKSVLAERPGVLHSFSGNLDMAKQAIAHNFYIGFTGPITFKKADDLRAIARELPLDKILVETDSPFLSPHPKRGKRNEPARVRLVADKMAEIKGLDEQLFAEQSSKNAKHLFNMELIA